MVGEGEAFEEFYEEGLYGEDEEEGFGGYEELTYEEYESEGENSYSD